MKHLALVTAGVLALGAAATAAPRQKGGWTVSVLTNEGQTLEGVLAARSVTVLVDGKRREVAVKDLLSLHTGDPASRSEEAKIQAGLTAVYGADRKARDAAEAELTEIGLPVLTPLLASYKDTDAHEPAPAYRLFARLIPGAADHPERTLDLVRLADGEYLRGDFQGTELKLVDAAGHESSVPVTAVRRLAVRRPEIRKTFGIHSLRHTTPISYLDTGVVVGKDSQVEETARGFVRLSFNVDGWSCDPDGLKVPGPNYKTNLYDGFPFGALLGRVGPAGERWVAGKHAERTAGVPGRLYLGINDNPHWQNNIGAFRVSLRVTDAYDVGEAQ